MTKISPYCVHLSILSKLLENTVENCQHVFFFFLAICALYFPTASFLSWTFVYGYTHPEFVFPLARMFTNEPLPSAILRYYGFISQTIDNLEWEEERCREEQETVFEALISNSNFRTWIQPIIQKFHEHHVSHRFHPYERTPLVLHPIPTVSLHRAKLVVFKFYLKKL